MTTKFIKRQGRRILNERTYEQFHINTLMMKRQGRANKVVVHDAAQQGAPFFAAELASLTGRSAAWLQEAAREYAACNKAWQQLSGLHSVRRLTLGYTATLDVAEGFALWALVKHLRPRVVVELGTQFGLSARLWKEALKAYVPDHKLYLCDLLDRRRFISDQEATFLEGDARVLLANVLDHEQVDILYNDAHPYDLIRWSLDAGIAHNVPCFAFHDVGGRDLRGYPYLVESAALSEEERMANGTNYLQVGHWERHCMAESFDPAILTQNAVENAVWKQQIFDSLFGFGVALRKENAPQP